MFFGGKLKAMPPKLRSRRRPAHRDPSARVRRRADIERYARAREFPLIPCSLCGSQDNMQRVEIKKMLREWEQRYPGRTESIFSSLRNVVPSHLADPRAARLLRSGAEDGRSASHERAATSCSRTARTASRGARRSLRWPRSRAAHGLTVESVDYRGMDDPAVRVRRLLEVCKTLPGELLLVGSSLGGHVCMTASRRRCRRAACSCWRPRSSCPATSNTRRAAARCP